VTGIVVGRAAPLAVIMGVEMNIHGLGAIVLAHGTWLVWTGIRLRRSPRG
jgi:hypothetical protein